MTLPDPDADSTSGNYTVYIGEGRGVVIGPNARVEQHFHGTPQEPQVDMTAAEAIYRQKVVDTYKWLNFSGFDRPDLSLANVPLEDVFVRLTLTVEKVIREPVPSEKSSQAERGERRQRERVITVQKPIELGQALDNHLLIVGEPGAGKSTLLRWLAVTFAQRRQREPNRVGPSADANRLPVLVELGHLPDRYVKPEGGETPNWIQLLPEYLTAQMAFTNIPPQLLTRALADGRCLLLFDGLDEVADRQARTRLARSLAELARFSPGNRVIIGSRPAGVSESEGALRHQFQRCQIERFTPEDVQRFIRFWYALDHGLTPDQQRDEADTLYARVQATPATLRLASTPLLSTILVLIWRNEGDLPARRVELYERCCRVLIERWEASHDVAYQGALVGMDWQDHLRLLTPLAYAIHSQEQRTSATRDELVPLLAKALQTAGYTKEQAAATREANQFLDALGLRSGLLQYIGDGRYGFLHQTFQEYLTARYIFDQVQLDTALAHRGDPWWEEVIVLYAELVSDASPLLRKLLGSRLEEKGLYITIELTMFDGYPALQVPAEHSDDIFCTDLILAGRCLATCPVIPEVSLRETIINFLFDTLSHTRYSITQKRMIDVLAEIGGKEVSKRLLLLLANERFGQHGVLSLPTIRIHLATALGRLGERSIAPDLLGLLIGELSRSDMHYRPSSTSLHWSIAAALGSLGERSIVPNLLQLFSDEQPHPDMRVSITMALGMLGERSVASFLSQQLSNEQIPASVREAIASALGALGERSIAPDLLPLLSDEQIDRAVRKAIASALGTLSDDESAVRALAGFLLQGSEEAIVSISDTADSIHQALWKVSRRAGMRVFMDDPLGKKIKVVKWGEPEA